ncbi:unnamed protein product [Sphagnum balticum]
MISPSWSSSVEVASKVAGNASPGVKEGEARFFIDHTSRHNPKMGVFTAYLDQSVGFNIEEAVLEEERFDDGLNCAFTHMSVRCNPPATMVVLREVAEMLPPDTVVTE